MKKKKDRSGVASVTALTALVVLHVANLILGAIGFGYLRNVNSGRNVIEGVIIWLVFSLLVIVSSFCMLIVDETREG